MVFTVAVAGATGGLGRLIVSELLKEPDIIVRALVRDPSKVPASHKSASSFQLVHGDALNGTALRLLVKGADVVVTAYTGDESVVETGQKLLIDISEAEGVPRYVTSDYTFDYTGLGYNTVPGKDSSRRVAEHLEGRKIQGVQIFIGAFMDTIWNSWFGMFNREDMSLSFWGTGEEIWEITSYQNTAEFTVAVALDKQAVGKQKFLGDRKTSRQLIEIFEEVYGIKPRVNWLRSFDELTTEMERQRAKDPQNFMSWAPLFYKYYCGNGQTQIGPDALDVTYPGLKHTSIKDFFKSVPLEKLASGI
ncbi:NmrA-like family protein [Paramyrothecium foliicola]|nr:NmrA-like family protein [Paramyrothecium foliicola]